MTAQIDDLFRLDGVEYAVAGISEGDLFAPADLGLRPAGMCTACYRGYQAEFALSGSHLVLQNLSVSLRKGDKTNSDCGPAINGVTPSNPRQNIFFNSRYEGLRLPLEYSGGLLLADGFIRELYVHRGFHRPWQYERVHELTFAGGVLQKRFDRTESMAEIRRRFLAARDEASADRGERAPPSDESVREWVERCFDRTYRG